MKAILIALALALAVFVAAYPGVSWGAEAA
jgi:hypothetical protein